MPISNDDFTSLIQLIEDGELDDRMIDLQRAIDDRNGRRKDDILKLVKSVWGSEAEIFTGTKQQTSSTSVRPRPQREYTSDDEPDLPPSAGDSMGTGWPTPIEAVPPGGGVGVSPVRDPMSDTGGEEGMSTTGATFG